MLLIVLIGFYLGYLKVSYDRINENKNNDKKRN